MELSEEQVLLQDTVIRYLREQYTFEERARHAALLGRWPSQWAAFSELGLLGAALPDDRGGLGGGGVHNMIISEAMGAKLVLEQFVELAVLPGQLLSRLDGSIAAALVDQLLGGAVLIAVADIDAYLKGGATGLGCNVRYVSGRMVLGGHLAYVPGAAHADVILVLAAREGKLALLRLEATRPGVRRSIRPQIDGARCAELEFDNVELQPEDILAEGEVAQSAVDSAINIAVAANCAELVGLMRSLLAQTLEYVRQRQQFGRPIGSFQALQHRLVNMHMMVEQAAALTNMAAMEVDADPLAAGTTTSAAKAFTASAAAHVAQEAVQMHGAIGVTDECQISHYFRRVLVASHSMGGRVTHFRRFAEGAPVQGSPWTA